MPSTEQVKMAWLQGCAVVPVGGREGRTRGDEVDRQPVGWMLTVQGCLGHAGDALSRGGLQVVLCKTARAGWGGHGTSSLHRGRIAQQRESNCRSDMTHSHSAHCTLHTASLVTTCPQPSPTAGPVVPTPWIVCRFRICSLCLALAGQPGPQSGHSFPGYLGSAAIRPCSNWSSHLPSARPQRRRPDKRQHCLDRCATVYWATPCRHSERAVLAKSWVPFLHLMPQLGTKFPLRCCSKRRWTRSALANQQIMQMRAFLARACLS